MEKRTFFLKWMCFLSLTGVIGIPYSIAATPQLTFQGRIIKSDSTALTDNAVQFKIQIRTPNAQECILFEETRTLDMSNSDGLFSISINDGNGTRTDGNSFNFTDALSNYKALSVSAAKCLSGSGTVTYTPGTTDERKVVIYFKDSTMSTWEAMPTSTLSHSAYAYEARKVGGFPASSLLRVEDATNGPQSATAFTTTQYNDLVDLVNGNSSKYASTSSSSGVALTQINGAPTTLAKGSIWYDSSDDKVKFYDGTSVVSINGGSTLSNSTGNVTLSPNSTTGSVIVNTTQGSTSTSTGALVVSGGAGVAENLYVGGNVNVSGNIVAGSGNINITNTASQTDAGKFKSSPTLSASVAGETTGSRSIASPIIQTGVTSAGPIIGAANSALRNYGVSGDTGTSSYLEGVQVNYGHSNSDASTPTTSNAYGILVYPHTKTGTITNMIDVFLASALTGTGTVTNGYGIYQQNTKNNYFAGNIGIGTSTPSAMLTLAAGTATAGTAPLKMTSGVLLATPEDGAIEYDGTSYYVTSGSTRRTIASGSSSGSVDNSGGNVSLNPNTTTGSVLVNSNVSSTGTTSGALVVSGGVGVGENLNVGGNASVTGSISSGTSVTAPAFYGGSSASGNLTIDSTSNATKGNIILAPSGGKVGIGTTAPDNLLDISGSNSGGIGGIAQITNTATNAAGNAVELRFAPSSSHAIRYSSIQGINTDGSNNIDLAFVTGSGATISEKMRVTATGKVGIGTTAPTSNLQLGTLTVSGTASPVTLSLGGTYSSTAGANPKLKIWESATAYYGLGVSTSSLDFIAGQATGTQNFYVNANTAPSMTIASTGNVGIGTTSPTSPLQISKTDTTTTGTVYGGLQITPTYNQASATTANTDLYINRTETSIGSGTQYLINAAVGGTTKFNVSNTGVVSASNSVGINGYGSSATLGVGGTLTTGLAGGTSGRLFDIAGGTITRSADTGTIAHAVTASIQTPTLAAGAATTYTNASTFYIAGKPTAGTNVTITNPWAAYINGPVYMAGNVGIGTTTPGTMLDVAGNMRVGSLLKRTEYYNSYSVPTATNVPINLLDGVSSLSNGWNYRIKLVTTGTGANTGAEYIVYQTAAGTWASTLVSAYALSSNSPNLSVSGTTVNIFHNHASTYAIATFVEGFYTNNTTITSSTFFGLEGAMTNLAGNIGVGTTNPTAYLQLKAGTATAGTAPLKLTAGTNLTTAEAGAIEYDGTNLYFTNSTPTRYTIATTSSGTLGGNVSAINNTGGSITLTPSTGNSVVVNQSTASTSTSTGALTVAGGVGVTGAMNVGSNIVSYGNIKAAASTAATSGSNSTSPYFNWVANYWDGAASQNDQWNVRNVMGTGANPTSTLTFSHSGSTGNASVYFPAYVNIGGASATTPFYVTTNPVNTAQTQSVFNFYPSVTSTGAYNVYGVRISAIHDVATGITNSGGAIAAWTQGVRNNNAAGTDDSGTLGSMRSSYVEYGHRNANTSATPITTNSHGVYVQPYAQSGTITTGYDLYLSTTLGTESNIATHYGVYQANSSAKNYFFGSVGIGTSPTSALHVKESITDAASTTASIAPTYTINTAGSYTDTGLKVTVSNTVANTISNSGTSYGSMVQNTRNLAADQGTINALVGSWIGYGHGASVGSTAVTTNAYGLYVQPYHNTAGSSITNSYGILLANVSGSAATVSNYWSLYQQDTTAKNYFAGYVGVGTSTPGYRLTVNEGPADPATTSAGIRVAQTSSITATNGNGLYGIYTNVQPTISASQTLASTNGYYSDVSLTGGAGTLTAEYGMRSIYGVKTGSTATVTSAYGLNIVPYHQAGTITNSYGLLLSSATTGGTATNYWALYQQDSTAKNYFAGNVGIGTSTPGQALEVVGNIKTYGTNGSFQAGNGTDTATIMNFDFPNVSTTSGTIRIFRNTNTTSTTNIDVFKPDGTGGTVSARINPTGGISFFNATGGNVGIGTSTPATALQVSGVISPAADNTSTLGSASYRFTTVYATNSTINTSDVREKKEIQLSDLGLDFISKLRPVSYKWKNGPDQDIHYGLIAQETEKTIKESLKKNNINTPIVDHDKATDKYGLRYTEFIAPIIKSIQELYSKWSEDHKELTEQKRQIASLQAKATEIDKLKLENEKLLSLQKNKDEKIKELERKNEEINKRLEKIEKILKSK